MLSYLPDTQEADEGLATHADDFSVGVKLEHAQVFVLDLKKAKFDSVIG